jgi:CRP-like cAMP-binding protein
MAVTLASGAGAVIGLQALCLGWLTSSVAASEVQLSRFDTELLAMAAGNAPTAQSALHASLSRQIDQALRAGAHL